MTVKEMRQLSRVVRFHRKQAGLTQQALARLAGVGKTVVFDVEHGKTTVRLATLMRILEALNIALEVSGPLMTRFEEESHDATR
jgi:y4mF family transcriptional regulator